MLNDELKHIIDQHLKGRMRVATATFKVVPETYLSKRNIKYFKNYRYRANNSWAVCDLPATVGVI
jgi:hypothetical protein